MAGSGKDHLLIDVREVHEYEVENLGGELIPLGQIESSLHKIPDDRRVVVHCRSGQRSRKAIERLQAIRSFENLYNLEGGILAWRSTEPSADQA